ncbi:MAG: hypothetical protein PHY93_17060 [Bacteriovorax sp.]|nr:hypothetical protein [Bacteriovorax sp.]
MNFNKYFFPDHFSRADRMGVLAIALFTIIVFIIFLNTTAHTKNRIKKPIARLETFSNKVRFKDSDSVSFYDVVKNEQLQNRDEIFTGENSIAVVRFLKSKTALKIPSSSLIKIEDGENGEAIEIKNGVVDIFIEKNQAINVKVAGVDHQITPSQKESTIKAYFTEGELHFFTKDNGVKIKTSSGEKEIKSNREAILRGSGIKFESSFILSSPTQGENFESIEGIKIKTNRKSKYKIALSKNSAFIPSLDSAEFNGANFEWETSLEEGDYFLKVEDKKNNKIVPITLTNKYKIDGFVPADGEWLNLNPGEGTTLRWNLRPVASYKVIVRDSYGKERAYITHTNELQLHNVKGSWLEWTVVPVSAKGNYSHIMKANHVGLKFNGKIEFIGLTKKTQYKTDEGKIKLAWIAQKGEQVLVKVRDVKNNKEFSLDQIKESSVVIPIGPSGSYVVDVASNDYPRSQKTEFNYDVNSPILIWDSKLEKEIKSTEENEEIVLKYKTHFDFAQNIGLHINYIPVKGNPIERKMKLGSSGKVKLEGFGQYCFKAQLNSPVKNYMDSDDYCLKLVQIPVFSFVPQAKDVVLTYLKHNNQDSYKLEVPSLNKAVRYHVEIYRDNVGKILVYSADSKTPDFFWTTNRSGIYYFRYNVYDAKNRPSEFSSFSKLIFPISPLSDW